MFHPATKEQSRARVALIGPSGSGKTYTGLILATTLANGGRVAVIDTERGSASKYADEFAFDVCELQTFGPLEYVKAIKAAESAGYTALLIDSLTHAWTGANGALEQVDKAMQRNRGNKFTAWGDVTPQHNALIDAMLQAGCHIVTTMRTKTEYVIEDDERGKKVPRKIGMAPIQRDGMEYEFDVTADLDVDHRMIVSKTRCPALDRAVIQRPDAEVGKTLLAWLSSGAAPQPRQQPATTPPKTAVDYIAAADTPVVLNNLLLKLTSQKPVAADAAGWTRIYKAAKERRETAGWNGEQAQVLDTMLLSLGDELMKIELDEESKAAFGDTPEVVGDLSESAVTA